jgi:hypothetical protein
MHIRYGIPKDENTKEALGKALHRVCKAEPKEKDANGKDKPTKAYTPKGKGKRNLYHLSYPPIADKVREYIIKYVPE